MRIHPVSRKRNIALREGIDYSGLEKRQQIFEVMAGNPMKRLRKLPHVFGKVLELPFRSDADVAVEESAEFFRFVAEIDFHGGDVNRAAAGRGGVRAQAVEIHPGITKIVVRKDAGDGSGGEVGLFLEQLTVDTWRFRLPASTMPELATAVFVDGELIVTVPKGGSGRGEFAGGDGGVWGGGGRLVLVQ